MNLMFVTKPTHVEVQADNPSSYLGAWKSAAGFITHELRADGTYLKLKGSRPASTGRYDVSNGRIAYETLDGVLYEGEFAEGRLHQAGMIFYKVM